MRFAEYSRDTTETKIKAGIELDGTGVAKVNTGVGFFDHMLTLLAKHGLFDITVECDGDLEVDAHHTVEDVAICLGNAIGKALGNKAGIKRYCTFYVPMDEALARVCIDVSGRPYCRFDAQFRGVACGQFDVQLAEEFFRCLAMEADITLHCEVLYGLNDHHMIEALFKAFARALDGATQMDGRHNDIPSTKGVL